MKALIFSIGEPDVKMAGNIVEIDLGVLGLQNDAHRENLRNEIHDLYYNLWDLGAVRVLFSDEEEYNRSR